LDRNLCLNYIRNSFYRIDF